MNRVDGQALALADLHTQIDALIAILTQSPVLMRCIDAVAQCRLPDAYVGAGAVVQTVWNTLTQQPVDAHINDLDVLFFDPDDMSVGRETAVTRALRGQLEDLAWGLDVKNQARVHLWYEATFGQRVAPFASAEAALRTWPAIASCVAVTRDDGGRWRVIAPFGLSDLFAMHVRANRTRVSQAVFEAKVARWCRHWPQLTVEPW